MAPFALQSLHPVIYLDRSRLRLYLADDKMRLPYLADPQVCPGNLFQAAVDIHMGKRRVVPLVI